MPLRGNNDLLDTDDSDEGLQTDLCTPERSRLQHGNYLSRTLTNRHERNTVTPLRMRDEGRSDAELEKQKMCISVARRERHMMEKKIQLRR